MKTSITMHTDQSGLKVSYEMPWNSFCISIVNCDGCEITFYCPIEQWWLLRQLPKSLGYVYSPSRHCDSIYDPLKADLAAQEFYNSHCERVPNSTELKVV